MRAHGGRARAGVRLLAMAALCAPGCGGAPGEPPGSVVESPAASVENVDSTAASATAEPTASTSAAPTESASAGSNEGASAAVTRSPELAVDSRFVAKRIFEGHAVFVSTGEDGRIGVLADEDGALVPHRRERGQWERLPLPTAYAGSATELHAGIYFGRDNRPRLMGYLGRGDSSHIVYLRFKDGRWQPELREIGPLGKDGPTPLFGVLGEADPEVVCRVGDRCLIKSRKGWKETPPSIPPSSVVRAFEGHGYAVSDAGLFRADDKAFVRIGPAAAWETPASGFWIGKDGAAVVVAPKPSRLFTLEPGGVKWVAESSPVPHPNDVAGPPSDRWLAAESGLFHQGAEGWKRIEAVSGPVTRVVVTPLATIAGGANGVFEIVAR